jgi:outer membrane autotransporter protein
VAAAAIAAAAFAGSAAAQNITVPDANVLQLLEPFLNLPNTTAGQQTLSLNMSQAILTNNQATTSATSSVTGNPVVESTSISDKSIFNGTSLSISLAATTTPSNGYIIASAYGPAANLAGGLPQQALQNGVNSQNQPTNGTVTPYQPYGGFGQLGGAYQTYVAPGQSNALITMLTTTYSFTSNALGVAKNYFADGATSAGGPAVVAPAGYSLPSVPGGANSTYDKYYLSQGYTYNGLGANVYGDTRPGQFNAPAGQAGIIGYDPNALTGLTTNPAFPSGHTNYAYTDSILLGMLSPQYFQSMLLRASEYGNSRIDLGVHYPLDIIASRSWVEYTLVQMFLAAPGSAYANTNVVGSTTPVNSYGSLTNAFTAAAQPFNSYLGSYATASSSTLGCATVAACAGNNAYLSYSSSTYSYQGSSNSAIFAYRQNYGLPTLSFSAAPREMTDGTTGPGNTAAILLATLYGGQNSTANALANAANGGTTGAGLYGNLTTATINTIIYNTETQALTAFYGTQLSYWSRIDLYDAAGYFSNVTGTLTLASTDVVNIGVTVGNGGVLGGNGTINSNVTFQSGGALGIQGNGAAGSAGYTGLTAQTATFNAGSKVEVTGGAFLPGGTFLPGDNKTYAILTTAGAGSIVINGSTANGLVNPANLAVDTSLSGNLMAFMTGQLKVSGDPILQVTFTANFNGAAVTNNQNSVATAIDTAANAGTYGATGATLLTNLILNNTKSTAPATFDSLGGEGITGQQQTALNAGNVFVTTVLGQATFWSDDRSNDIFGMKDGGSKDGAACSLKDGYDCAIASRGRAWAAGFGQYASLDGQSSTGSASLTSHNSGVATGVDFEITRTMIAGIAGGYSDSTFSVSDRATSGTVEGGHFGVYGVSHWGAFYAASTIDYAHYDNTTDRFVTGLGGIEEEKGRFSSDEWISRFEAGYKYRTPDVNVTPFAGYQLATLSNSSFSEFSTGVAGLHVNSQTIDSDKTFLGVQFDTKTVAGDGWVLTPYARLSWEHEFNTDRSLTASLLALPGSGFTVYGASAAADVARLNTGFKLDVSANVALFASFDGEFSDRGNTYAGTGGVKIRW